MKPTPGATSRIKLFPTFRGWWIVIITFISLFLHGATTSYLFGILVVPMEEDLGWSRTVLTGALTVATFVTAGVALLIGPLFDRHGVRMGMTVSAMCGGFILVLLAFVQAPWQYYLLLGLGIGATRASLENVGPRTAIANWFVRRRPAAFAWSSGGRALFGIVLVPPIAFVVAETSWRVGWALMGVLSLVILVPLCWGVVRRRPEDFGQLPDGDSPRPASAFAGQPGAAARLEVQWTRAEAVRTRAFWYIVLGFILTGLPATGIIANMVPYFRDNGMAPVMASWAFSAYALGAMGGRPVWAVISARHGVQAALTVWGFSYGASIALFVLTASSAVLLFLAAVPLGVCIGGSQQLQSQAWPDYFGRRSVGAITGLTMLFITPSTAFGPLVAAFAHGAFGTYLAVFSVYGAAAFLAGICFHMARRPVKPVS